MRLFNKESLQVSEKFETIFAWTWQVGLYLSFISGAIEHGLFRCGAFPGMYVLLPYLIAFGVVCSFVLMVANMRAGIQIAMSIYGMVLGLIMWNLKPSSFSSSAELDWFSTVVLILALPSIIGLWNLIGWKCGPRRA